MNTRDFRKIQRTCEYIKACECVHQMPLCKHPDYKGAGVKDCMRSECPIVKEKECPSTTKKLSKPTSSKK